MDEYQQMMQEAQAALSKGSWKTALALSLEAQKLSSGKAEPLLLQTSALMDGGLFSQALEVLDRAEEISLDDPVIITNRGICMFELCRFDSAEGVLALALELDKRLAQAHYYMGLVLERKADWVEANKSFARANQLEPETFSLPVSMDDEEFISVVEDALMALPADAISAMDTVTTKVQLLPEQEDLLAYDPPLSPQILGLGLLFPPKEGSIVLYQRALQRIAGNKADLAEQIKATILHELQTTFDI